MFVSSNAFLTNPWVVEKYKLDPSFLTSGVKGKTFAVQGFGNVGSAASVSMHDAGARLIFVNDSKSSVR